MSSSVADVQTITDRWLPDYNDHWPHESPWSMLRSERHHFTTGCRRWVELIEEGNQTFPKIIHILLDAFNACTEGCANLRELAFQ